MIRNSIRYIVLLCIAFSAIGPSTAFGQLSPSPNNLTITPSATTPAPGQSITITAQSFTTNIDAATITWTANGKVIQSGVGLTTIDFKTPPLGKKTTIVVTATSPQGSKTSGSIIINPSSIDIIVETDGSTPPTFLGKIDPAYQNTVTIIAMPHLINAAGAEYDPKSLIYTWRKDDGTVIKDQSGYGKQSVSIKGDIIPHAYSIVVSVTSRDGTAQGQSVVDITPQAPTVLFYQNDPLYGPLFNLAIGDAMRIGAQKETTILASPFGFNGTVSYSWTTNNTTHPELANHTSITLRAPDNQAGRSSIGVELTSPGNILQQAKSTFTALFDTTGSRSNTTNVSFQ